MCQPNSGGWRDSGRLACAAHACPLAWMVLSPRRPASFHLIMSCCCPRNGQHWPHGHSMSWSGAAFLPEPRSMPGAFFFFNALTNPCKFIQLCRHNRSCSRSLPSSPQISLTMFSPPCFYPQPQANTHLLSVSVVFAFSRNFT